MMTESTPTILNPWGLQVLRYRYGNWVNGANFI